MRVDNKSLRIIRPRAARLNNDQGFGTGAQIVTGSSPRHLGHEVTVLVIPYTFGVLCMDKANGDEGAECPGSEHEGRPTAPTFWPGFTQICTSV